MVWQVELIKHFKDDEDLLVNSILDGIKKMRDGVELEFEPFKTAILSFVQVYAHMKNKELELYTTEIETPYLKTTRDYYESESKLKMGELNVPDYVKYAIKRTSDELDISKQVLMEISIPKVEDVLRIAFIGSKLDSIHTEFKKMILKQSFIECASIYKLISKVEGALDAPIKDFESYVLAEFEALANKFVNTAAKVTSINQDALEYIDGLISKRDELKKWCLDCFENDALFIAAIDRSIKSIFNAKGTFKYAEAFSKCCDKILKTINSKNIDCTEPLEAKLFKTIDLAFHFDDQDLFQKYYSRALAKRLIFSKFSDTERLALSHLKSLFGYEFTSKMQRMINDLTISSENMNEFKVFANGKFKEFNVHVLTHGIWPLPPNTNEYRLPLQV